jgi:hypothetical protein
VPGGRVSTRRFDAGDQVGSGPPQSPSQRFIDACPNDQPIAIGTLIHDLAATVNLGEQLSVPRREMDLGERTPCANG